MEFLQTLPAEIVIFFIFTFVIATAGTYFTRIADKLADVTKLGEALFGAIFVGISTSLPGIVASVTAAYQNHPQLAVSNAIGGIILQTAFLGIADIAYRKANIEHASASLTNLMQGGLLILLLTLVLLGMFTPDVSFLGISPTSILLIVIYLAGIKLIAMSRKTPMWRPRKTPQTVADIPHYFYKTKRSVRKLWLQFFIFALIVAFAGFMITEAGIGIVAHTRLPESFVGGLFTAGSSSIPELVVAIAAVRQGSLALAMGDIIGGNTFDILFIAFADFAFHRGSIYHALATTQVFMIALTLSLTTILLIGLLYREKYGPGRIGWESLLILILSMSGYCLIFFKLV